MHALILQGDPGVGKTHLVNTLVAKYQQEGEIFLGKENEEQWRDAKKPGLKILILDEYNLEEFLKHTISNIDARCGYCYSSRLEATAKAAKENGFDYFSSSLLYSKYQNHDEIKNIGNELAEKYGISFYYDDFRIGWKQGNKESKDMGLYRQKYCGCIFSEKERYFL